jgi:hypothetical protein
MRSCGMIIFVVGSMLLLGTVNAAQADRDGGLTQPRQRRAIVCSSLSNLENMAPRSTRLERFEFTRGGESLAQDKSNVPDEDLEDNQQQQLQLLDEFRAALRQRLDRDRTQLAQTWASLEQDWLERHNNRINAKTTTVNTSLATIDSVAPKNASSEPHCTLDDPLGSETDQGDGDATLFRPRWFGWGRRNIALRDKQRPRAVASNSTTSTMNEEMVNDADQSNNDSVKKAIVPATISVTSMDGRSFKDPFPIKIKKGKRKTLVSDLGMEWSYPADPTASPDHDETDPANQNETDEDGTALASLQTEHPTAATQRTVLAAVRVVVQLAVWAFLMLCMVWVGQVVHSLLFGIGSWISTARVSPPPAPSGKQKLADSQSSASAAATAAPLTKRLLNRLQRH